MIMTVNPETHEILLTSIPRDAYVQLHDTKGNKDKLTHSGIYGLNMTKTTIEDFLNIKIDYVVKVGFGTVINVVDTIGGIDIYSDRDINMRGGDGGAVPTQVYKGWNHFSGPQALRYARERKGYPDGDNHRVQNQQQVLEAIFTKVITDKSLLVRYDEVLNSLSSLYVTDIPSSFIKMSVKQQLSDMKSWKIEKQQVSGEGKMGVETYSMPGWKLWVMLPYESSVKKNSQNINDMINGKSLSELKLK
jgi:LCP family protein required for cell wall assembly